jgi:hypothetical protein
MIPFRLLSLDYVQIGVDIRMPMSALACTQYKFLDAPRQLPKQNLCSVVLINNVLYLKIGVWKFSKFDGNPFFVSQTTRGRAFPR